MMRNRLFPFILSACFLVAIPARAQTMAPDALAKAVTDEVTAIIRADKDIQIQSFEGQGVEQEIFCVDVRKKSLDFQLSQVGWIIESIKFPKREDGECVFRLYQDFEDFVVTQNFSYLRKVFKNAEVNKAERKVGCFLSTKLTPPI